MPQVVPQWATAHFNDLKKNAISQKITEIEQHTQGEVVVIVAERSSTVGHSAYSLFVSILLIITSLDIVFLQSRFPDHALWTIVGGFILSAVLTVALGRFHWVQRLFVPREDLAEQVEMRAELEFYRHGLQKTDGSTGVLLFVSLFEHQAVVLGDKTISQKLSGETWEKILADLTSEAKKGNLGQGILAALDDISPILSQHFPAQEKNPNELPDHLIFV